MKKIFILIPILLAWTASLPAQITREQADAIVLDYLKNEVTKPYLLHVNVNTPNEEGFVVTTYMEETVKVKYACWVYCVDEYVNLSTILLPTYRYLFVKEDNGTLLEIIAHKDLGPLSDITAWKMVYASTGLVEQKGNNKSLYPNPVDDWLNFPCNGESVRVEIYDLKGTRLFSGTLSGKGTCQLNVSFLSAGVYMVNVSGETYKIIKN